MKKRRTADAPAKFEAGTPNVADAVGLGAALDYVNRLGLPNIAKYEQELLNTRPSSSRRINGLRLIGTAREKVGVLSFVLADRPTEEVGRLLDLEGIAVRAGHHCASRRCGDLVLEATVRPSFSLLQHAGGDRPPGRCGQADSANLTVARSRGDEFYSGLFRVQSRTVRNGLGGGRSVRCPRRQTVASTGIARRSWRQWLRSPCRDFRAGQPAGQRPQHWHPC